MYVIIGGYFVALEGMLLQIALVILRKTSKCDMKKIHIMIFPKLFFVYYK
jgi:hypothetical protein